VEPLDRSRTPDLARRERRLRQDLEAQARGAKRRLDDAAVTARRTVENPPATRPSPPVARRATGERSWEDLDDQILVWALPVAAVAAVPLLVGHVSAVIAHGEAPAYRLVDAPGILGRFLGNLGDPGRAWEPVNTGGAVPGPLAYWGTFALVAGILGLVALLVWAAVRAPSRSSAGWGTLDDQPGLRSGRKEAHRLVLGTAGNQQVAVRERHSVLVVGPAHSGKTSGLVVPAIVEWDGPVVVAATKGHLIDNTIGWRSRHGDVHVYDPAASTRYHRSGWSLLADCGTWSGAIRTAADLTLAARAAARVDLPAFEHGGDAWRSSLSMALAPYLLAAVASGRSIGQTAEWIESEERDEVFEVLRGVDQSALRAHRTTFARPDETRSRFLHSMHEILRVYDDPVVASSMDRHEIEAPELLDGGANTLYLTSPEYDQERFRPLCALIVRRVIAAAYEISARTSAPLDPPLLVVLDDVPGIAPVYDLAALASTAAARGVQLVSVFQDPGQIAEQYREAADMVVRNHRARVVLPDGRDPAWRVDEPLLAPALVPDLGEGEAALVYGTHRPLKVALRPWFEDRELRKRVETPQDDVRPAGDDVPRAQLPSAEQSAAWLRRASGRRLVRVDDPTIPIDMHDRNFVEVFGSIDEDDTGPLDVTPITQPRRPRR
jgi:type IV secretion system protein VirD4